MSGESCMNNIAQKVTRSDKDAWDIATDLADEYKFRFTQSLNKVIKPINKRLSEKSESLFFLF